MKRPRAGETAYVELNTMASVIDVPSAFTLRGLLRLLFALPLQRDLLQEGDRVENHETRMTLPKLLILHQVEKMVVSTDQITSPGRNGEVVIGLVLGVVR